MGMKLEELPPEMRARAMREMMRAAGRTAGAAAAASLPPVDDGLMAEAAAKATKKRRRPVVVGGPVFCAICGSYQHERARCGRIMGFLGKSTRGWQGFAVPIRTENVGNGAHGNPFEEASRRKKIRKAVGEAWRAAGIKLEAAGYCVTITRISSGSLDTLNLDLALKSVLDEVAARMGVDDSSPLVEWKREQEKGEPNEPAVRIEIARLP